MPTSDDLPPDERYTKYPPESDSALLQEYKEHPAFDGMQERIAAVAERQRLAALTKEQQQDRALATLEQSLVTQAGEIAQLRAQLLNAVRQMSDIAETLARVAEGQRDGEKDVEELGERVLHLETAGRPDAEGTP